MATEQRPLMRKFVAVPSAATALLKFRSASKVGRLESKFRYARGFGALPDTKGKGDDAQTATLKSTLALLLHWERGLQVTSESFIASAGGSTKTYTQNLAHGKTSDAVSMGIEPGSVVFVCSDTQESTITDVDNGDGTGTLIGSAMPTDPTGASLVMATPSGTINYSTGAVTINYPLNIRSGKNVKVSYIYWKRLTLATAGTGVEVVDEAYGNTSASVGPFTHTLAQHPVAPGSVTLVDAADSIVATDNGLGGLIGTGVDAASSIVYSTGVTSLKLSSAASGTNAIKATYQKAAAQSPDSIAPNGIMRQFFHVGNDYLRLVGSGGPGTVEVILEADSVWGADLLQDELGLF